MFPFNCTQGDSGREQKMTCSGLSPYLKLLHYSLCVQVEESPGFPGDFTNGDLCVTAGVSTPVPPAATPYAPQYLTHPCGAAPLAVSIHLLAHGRNLN